MFTLLGLVIVFTAILGGYVWAGGPLHVLVQPAGLAIIGGAALGGTLLAAPLCYGGRQPVATNNALQGPATARYLRLVIVGVLAALLGLPRTLGAVGALDATPKEIGHNVGAALVGTFLGILLCYGVFQPVATNIELQELASARYLRCIKEGVVASLRGTPPLVVVEFARRAIFTDERPTAAETDAACRAVKSALA